MGTELTEEQVLDARFKASLRDDLETAWLRGYAAADQWKAVVPTEKERKQMAADYAERVVGGSTRPGKPETSRSLGEQSSPQRPERPEAE